MNTILIIKHISHLDTICPRAFQKDYFLGVLLGDLLSQEEGKRSVVGQVSLGTAGLNPYLHNCLEFFNC